jgi:CHAT domain-containing protein
MSNASLLVDKMGKFNKFFIFFLFIFYLFVSYPLSGTNHFEKKFKEGIKLQKNGEYKEAIDKFSSVLEFSDSNFSNFECLYRLSILFWNIGEIEKAKTFCKRGFLLSLKQSKKKYSNYFKYSLEVISNYNKAKNERDSNNWEKSIEYFKKAAFFSEKLNSPELEIKCLRQLSISYWYINEFGVFINLNKKCLVLSQKLNHSKEKCRCLINFGAYYDLYDQYSMALIKYFEGLKIAEARNYTEEKSSCYLNISTIYLNLGMYDDAYDYLLKAYRIDENLGNMEFIAQDLNNLGLIKKKCYKQKRNIQQYIESINHFLKALELAEKNKWPDLEIKIINNLGNLFFENGEYKKAILYFQRGLDKRTENTNLKSEVMLLLNMGFSYLELNRPEAAIENFHIALSSGSKLGAYHVLWEIYYGIGRYYEQQKKSNDAIQWYEKSIQTIQKMKRHISLDTHQAGYLSDKIKVYERLLNLYFIFFEETGSELFVDKMFFVVEQAKSNTILENLQRSNVNIFNRITSKWKISKSILEQNMSKILEKLSEKHHDEIYKDKLFKEFHKLEEEHIILLSEIGLEYPQIAQIISPDLKSIEEIQKYLKKTRSSIIEYFIGQNKSYVFFVSPRKKAVFHIKARETLGRVLQGTLKYLSDPDLNEHVLKKSLVKITNYLLPFSTELTSIYKNLIIIPDGELCYFPFEVLITDQSESYLVDDFIISYMPSSFAYIYLSNEQNHIEDFRLLLIGSPEYKIYGARENVKILTEKLLCIYREEGYSFSSLPFSGSEIEEIAKLFPSNKTEIFFGPEASESNIKNLSLSDFNCIHFACHGFINSNPFRSALILSPEHDAGEDGLLQVREIYELELNADLVVLSACETGKGLITQGEGLLGISRVFFYSGARSIISTLWKIDDKSTSLFMNYLYGFLKYGNNKAAALRKAKVEMRKKHENPFFWAPYVLSGDCYGIFEI